MQPRVCVNCGAPLEGSKCEYCGSVYHDENEERIRELLREIQKVELDMRIAEQTQYILNTMASFRPI